jgi:hypothetical protein
MNSNGILHLTVNSKGDVALWPTPQEAIKSKGPHDVMMQISLTAPQMRMVLRAEALAKSKVEEASGVRTD